MAKLDEKGKPIGNPLIAVKSLSKTFADKKVIKNVSFNIKKGEIVTLFGPNGCGKTTILNMLCGLVGKDDKKGSSIIAKFKLKELSYIFQNYRDSLLPWRTNYENIAFPLELQNIPQKEIEKRIKEITEIFDFREDLKKYPYQLSGGQQQILAFLRALATMPSILFVDEPFSALDYENNLLVREHMQKYYLKYKPAILMITHDIEEAVHLSNKIIVFSDAPSVIVNTIHNFNEHPRKIDFLKTVAFHKMKDKVLSAFIRGTKR